MTKELYAVKSQDRQILDNCTSGGFISTLVRYYLSEKKGIVYGVELGEDFVVRHVRLDKAEDSMRIAGSKYVASDMRGIIQRVRNDLENGEHVLFIGTPCQCAAVRKLRDSTIADGLCIVDLVCHGTVSQQYFDSYMEYLRERYNDIKKFRFRDKTGYGLSCVSSIEVLRNGQRRYKKLTSPKYNFYYFYMKGDGFRECCYNCKFTNLDRPGDLTIGDFWGIEKIDPAFDSSKGVSAVLINSEMGRALFETVKCLFKYKQENLEAYLPHNAALTCTVSKGSEYERCQNMLKTGCGKQIFQTLYRIKLTEHVKGWLKGILPSVFFKLKKQIKYKI